MDELIRHANSKRASNTTPHIIRILQEHSERLLKLEAMLKISTYGDPQEFSNKQEEDKPVVISTKTKEVKFEPIEMDEPEEIVPDSINPLIVELQEKLCRITNEADVLAMELETLNDLEDETTIEEDNDDASSVCTADCREMIKIAKPELERIGSWQVDEECNDCTKKKIKLYKNEKKKKDKERAKAQALIKQKQKDLIKAEQKSLQLKLNNIKKGRAEEYGIDTNRQTKMREELKKLATDYDDLNKGSHFSINMYV